MTPDMKAREAAAKALYRAYYGDDGGDDLSEDSAHAQMNADLVIDAYLAALSPLPDERLDEIEKRWTGPKAIGSPWPAATTREVEAYRTGANAAAEQVRLLLAEARRAQSSHPDEETVTSEPDVTWPGDLRIESRIRASRDLIREANTVRDLDGTGIIGRLADMLAGWLVARPTPEGSTEP